MKTGKRTFSTSSNSFAPVCPGSVDRRSNSDRMAERMCLATIRGLRRLKVGASMAPPRSRSGSSKK